MREKSVAWLTVLSCVATTLGSAPLAAAQPPLESGSQLYAKYCASCHGIDARGATELARLFAKPPPDLTRFASRQGGWFPERLVEEIIDGRFAAHGRREMPVWGETLTRDQIMLVTEHLYRLQHQEAPAAP
jgi:mono/diheme cytochrome c family protein